MIPNQWYPILESLRVRRRPVAVARMGERLVLWRDSEGLLVCMRDRCPHRGVQLSRGRVRDGTLECGYHGFRFAGDGTCVAMPCEGPDARIPSSLRATTLPVEERYGLVWLFFGAEHAPRPEIPWFDECGERRRGTWDSSHVWPLNYVRTLESNFDMHHTPFLHRSIFPVGARLDSYHVEVEGSCIRTRGELRREGKSSGFAFRLDFKAPSVTFLGLSEKLYAIVADCPIDEQNTWRFLRYYQDYTRIPGLAEGLSWFATQVEWRLAQFLQDLPMVRTQEPRLPGHDLDHLVRADAGTAAYLKLRRKLLAEAAARGEADARPDLREARGNRVPDLQPAGQPQRPEPAAHGAARGGLAGLSR
jgi:nitrite reductase/ring-hydroxylating ferredoxin subunit